MKKHFLAPLLFIFGSSLLLSCNTLEDQLKSQAEITGAAQADRTIQATNEDLAQKVDRMEADLAARERFYQCLAGSYEGTVHVPADDPLEGDLEVVMTLTANLPPHSYNSGRHRTESEVAADLSLVGFRVNVQLSSLSVPDVRLPGSDGVLPGNFMPINFDNVQSDLVSGKLDLISASNPTQFVLWLMPEVGHAKGDEHALVGASSAGLMRSIVQGHGCQVPSLWMDMRALKISPKLYGAELHRSVAQ
jgi:hypothetical protein